MFLFGCCFFSQWIRLLTVRTTYVTKCLWFLLKLCHWFYRISFLSCASYEAVWFQILKTCKNLTEHRMKFSGSAWKMMHFLSGVTLYVCFSTFTWLCIIFFSSSPTICHSGSFFVLFFFSLAHYVCSDKLHLLQWNFHQMYCLVHVLTKKKTARQKCHIFWYIIRI